MGNAFTALNGALLTDGPYVHIEKNTVAKKPVQLIWVSTEKGARAHHPRILITAGENSQAEIVESFVDISSSGGYLNNVVGEYVLEAGANIHVYKVIEEGKGYHLATQRVRQQRDSHYTSHVFNLSGAIARNEISVLLDGEGAGCSLHGLYLTEGDELVDNRQEITHAKPNCTSWIGYKGVLDGKSNAVYTGKIYVDRIAQKTDSNQLNQNVLLSDKAQIDTKPQLEIYADDVKCTHGATIGQFSDELVYYFQTRGIAPDMARAMLTYGFADEVVDEVKIRRAQGASSMRLSSIVIAPRLTRISASTMSTVQEDTKTTAKDKPLSAAEVAALREDFPILKLRPHDQRLAYLDNAATTQKPQQVIDAITDYYEKKNANVHRGVHYLSQVATEAYEGARLTVKHFINATLPCEIVFTRGTTDAINLVAQSYSRGYLKEGDEVVISHMEHHSNIVPWQIACEQTGAKLRVIPINDNGELDMDAAAEIINEKTKFVSLVYVSNALGTVNPVKKITEMAHAVDAPVMLDAAQAAPHMAIDVMDLDCDFLAISAHKMFGPTGFGVLYGRAKIPPRYAAIPRRWRYDSVRFFRRDDV